MTTGEMTESASAASSPLYARIAANLREEILNGVLEPGQRLQEQVVAERYGVSRVPVRDALRRLEVEGLIEMEPNRGAFVGCVTAEEAVEMLRVRLVLEEMLGRDAARNRTDEQVEELRLIVAEGTSSVRGASPAQLVGLNTRFHQLLGQASHNPTAAGLVEQLRTRNELQYSGKLPRRAESSWKEHAAIVEAIAAGDSDAAARAVNEHLMHAAAEWEMELVP